MRTCIHIFILNTADGNAIEEIDLGLDDTDPDFESLNKIVAKMSSLSKDWTSNKISLSKNLEYLYWVNI